MSSSVLFDLFFSSFFESVSVSQTGNLYLLVAIGEIPLPNFILRIFVAMERAVVNSGDAIRAITESLYSSLVKLLSEMAAQSEDLRTHKLRDYCTTAKKILVQLYAVCKWLDTSELQSLLRGVAQIKENILEWDRTHGEQKDALFYIHASLHAQRIPSVDIETAQDIICRKTYSHLPSAMFAQVAPFKTVSALQRYQCINVLAGMNVALKTRCALVERIPVQSWGGEKVFRIRDGQLIASFPGMYELALTLSSLDPYTASWELIDFKITVRHSTSEGLDSRMDLDKVVDCVKTGIRTIIEKSSDSSLDMSLTDEESSRTALEKIIGLCNHTALSIVARYLYVQAREYSKMLSRNVPQSAKAYFEPSFVLSDDAETLSCRFWCPTNDRCGIFACFVCTISRCSIY